MNPYQVLAIQTPSPRSAAISGRSRRCTGRLLTSIPSAEGFPSNLPQSERSIFRISDASGHWFLLVGESTVPVSRAYKHNNNKLTVKPTESNCETRLARTCALAAAKAPVKKAAPVKVAAPAKKAAPAKVAAPAKKAAPAKVVAPAKKAAPAKVVAPAKKAAPAKVVAPAKKAAPAKVVVPAKTAAPAKVAAPAKTAAPVKVVAPAKKAAPVKVVAPAKKAK